MPLLRQLLITKEAIWDGLSKVFTKWKFVFRVQVNKKG